MAQMSISIPDKVKRRAEQRVAEGRYSSTSDYVRDLVRRDQEREEQVRRLQAAIDAGRASGVSEQDPFDHLATLGAGLSGGSRSDEIVEALRALWKQGLESGGAIDGNFEAGEIADRGAARLAAARRGGRSAGCRRRFATWTTPGST
jgi:antitoxin ParD1/3/4